MKHDTETRTARKKSRFAVGALALAALGTVSFAQTSVTVAGSLQSEVGCPSEWDPSCTASALAFNAATNTWSGTFVLPAGDYEYKVAIDNSWAVSYPAGNVQLSLPRAQAVWFVFYPGVNVVADSVNERQVNVVGSFQSEVGCGSDWLPACETTRMRDPDRDGTYELILPVVHGPQSMLVVIDESFSITFGEGGLPGLGNFEFDPPPGGATMVFRFRQNEFLTADPILIMYDDFESGDLRFWQ